MNEPKELDNLFKDFKEEKPIEKPVVMKKEEKLKYKDSKGNVAEPQKLSDLERNNSILKGFLILLYIWTAMILAFVWYTIDTNFWNNVIYMFTRC